MELASALGFSPKTKILATSLVHVEVALPEIQPTIQQKTQAPNNVPINNRHFIQLHRNLPELVELDKLSNDTFHNTRWPVLLYKQVQQMLLDGITPMKIYSVIMLHITVLPSKLFNSVYLTVKQQLNYFT